MTQHTPTPWRVRRRSPDDAGFVEADKIDPKMAYNIEILGDDEMGYPTKAADVDFIVLACNSHDALLAAAEVTLPALEQAFIYLGNEVIANQVAVAAKQLRAAIALATLTPSA